MTKFSKAIGIVGGAGPMASCFLYKRLIELCQEQFGANDYNEFPEIILESYPFIRGNKERLTHDIALCLKKLQSAGAALFCVASHSFHGFLPNLSSIEFVHLVNETLQEASRCHISKALILAAQPTIDMKLYEKDGLPCYYPDERNQGIVKKIIREVAGGMITQEQATQLKNIIQSLQHKEQLDGVILACTELPLIHRQVSLDAGIPVIDSVSVLAHKLLILASG
jgi:aspartate racemase